MTSLELKNEINQLIEDFDNGLITIDELKCKTNVLYDDYKEKSYQIEEWEDFIDEYEESFINNFAPNAWIIDSIWFNSSHMKVCYIMTEGNHITNTFTLKEFENWKINIAG